MFMLNTVSKEEATGKVAEAYGVFPDQMPVPVPLQLMSASPELVKAQSGIIRYFINHGTIDTGLLAMIRYCVAHHLGYQYCIDFNATLLQQAGGMSAEELQALQSDPENAPLEDSQKALLLFVLKVVKSPEAVTQTDVAGLRDLGWSEQDIFDAAFHGASMNAPSTLFKAFSA